MRNSRLKCTEAVGSLSLPANSRLWCSKLAKAATSCFSCFSQPCSPSYRKTVIFSHDSSVDKYISLPVLSVTRVMIAQWENKCISLSVLPVARVISGRMNVSHWLSSLWSGFNPDSSGVFLGIFPWLITLCQPVMSQRGRKWFHLSSMVPHTLWKSRRKAEIQPQMDNGEVKR